MKKYFFISIAVAGLFITACEKPKDFVADNAIPNSAGYNPMCTNGLIDMATNKGLGTSAGVASVYAANATFKTELQYFSQSPIKEIVLYNTIGSGARTKVGTWPYASAYSQIKRLDTLLVPYTMPQEISGTVIKLEYDIVNQNSLSLISPRTVFVKVQ